MKEERPFYKSGYIVGLLIALAGGFLTQVNSDLGGGIGAIGLMVMFITPFKRLISQRKAKKAAKTNFTASTTTAVASPAPMTSTSISHETQSPVAASQLPEQSTKPSYKYENHRVAGTSFHKKEIESLGTYNYDYDLTKNEFQDSCMEGERVYQYEFDCSRVNLVPEPENKYDSNAIRVEVEGVHIGYIKKGSTSRIRKLMEKDMIRLSIR